MIVEDGSRERDLAEMAEAQQATARTSYGRDLTAIERDRLTQRLAAAFGSERSRIRVARGPQTTLIGYFWLEKRDGHAFVLDIFVAVNARRSSVGALLWRDLLECARALGCAEVRLAVSERNVAGLAFFRHLGLIERDREVREGLVWYELHAPAAA